MSDKSATTPEFTMDSKIVIAIIAVTVTTVAAVVCTRKYILDKKQPTSPEKRILRRKQRSMMKSIISIEDSAKKMLEDIKKVQGIIVEFMKKKKETIDDENTIVEADTVTATTDNEKTDNEGKAQQQVKPSEPQSLTDIRVDGLLMEMKLKGLDEFLLRLLEQLDSLRPNALMDEAREMCADKEDLTDVIPYIEHKVEKIKKRKKTIVVKIQSYLDNVDKLVHTVSGQNKDITVVESVAQLWEVKENEEDTLSNDDEKKDK
ncbi:hypothetical protein BCR36DRAFT_584248 [Piromyces finnis]|uniref:Uncharacterized protein n=1 Tax=Piromyces finnis TaxID=1754191 RepID=A0A1Y1V714_9FUNG|nr:hypothetical protein BCR36DRAFT_584248 [Piromyces finnis]|eukprot:ORX48696.1 hypothetical protein BCR36DRAFT_584248 [Piromyces finnis]